MNLYKRVILIFILCIITCISFTSISLIPSNEQYIVNTDTIITDTIEINKDSIFVNIIDEVSKYINKQSPKAHKQLSNYLVDGGLNYNIDICFMMAQTQIETNFGTTGIGKETSKKSLFGVMRSYKYLTYEEAITDYCKILLKNYLGKGKTEQHLMKKYVTHGGARYASNPRYEYELTNAYNIIINKTQIQSLQKQLNDIL